MSSNHAVFPGRPFFSRIAFPCLTTILIAASALDAGPLGAQDDGVVTQTNISAAPNDPESGPAAEEESASFPPRIDLSVTVPRGDVNEAQVRACEDDAEAGQISGEIVVCRRLGEDGANYYSGSRTAAQKRYAQETAFKGAPRAPDFIADCKDQGNPFGCIGLGKAPPPALIIDVGALPTAPPGSDADRIARGLPPLGQDDNLSEDEIRKRREKLGLPPPAFERNPE